MGNNADNSGILMFLMWVGTIALSIYSGIIAYDWVEPESFFGVIGFIVVWGIFAKIAHFVMFSVVYMLFDN